MPKSLNHSRPNPGERKKIHENFYFRTCLWCLKRFYEDLKSRHKTFRGTTKVCGNKNLRILTGKKHRQIKLQRLQKLRIWAFESLVHQINSLWEVLKLKQNFQKNKVVNGKTPFFVIGPFCTHHSICLNIGFWYGSFVWKWCVFNLSAFN